MTGRQKFLLSIAYRYCPQYEIKFDRDRDVMALRVWIDKCHFLSIIDVPSLAGTNNFQVRYHEQTKSYFSPSPKVGLLDSYFGKKNRKPGAKYIIADAYYITDVLKSIKYEDKTKRTPLQESTVWCADPRDVFF